MSSQQNLFEFNHLEKCGPNTFFYIVGNQNVSFYENFEAWQTSKYFRYEVTEPLFCMYTGDKKTFPFTLSGLKNSSEYKMYQCYSISLNRNIVLPYEETDKKTNYYYDRLKIQVVE